MNDNTSYRIINLSSGDNIIGQLVKKEESSITIYRPFQMKIITLMDQAGPLNMFRQEALVMRNWLELSEEEHVTIPMEQIVVMTSPTEKVKEHYNEEKEKEDNPEYMENLLDKLKSAEADALDELDDSPFYENGGVDDSIGEIVLNNMDPSDMRDIINNIIEDFNKGKQEDNLEEIEDDDCHDTDKDMYGW